MLGTLWIPSCGYRSTPTVLIVILVTTTIIIVTTNHVSGGMRPVGHQLTSSGLGFCHGPATPQSTAPCACVCLSFPQDLISAGQTPRLRACSLPSQSSVALHQPEPQRHQGQVFCPGPGVGPPADPVRPSYTWCLQNTGQILPFLCLKSFSSFTGQHTHTHTHALCLKE